jgi:hypothetical protein
MNIECVSFIVFDLFHQRSTSNMPEHKVHHAAFNQNKSLLAVCVEDGLRIFRWNDQLQIKPATNKSISI